MHLTTLSLTLLCLMSASLRAGAQDARQDDIIFTGVPRTSTTLAPTTTAESTRPVCSSLTGSVLECLEQIEGRTDGHTPICAKFCETYATSPYAQAKCMVHNLCDLFQCVVTLESDICIPRDKDYTIEALPTPTPTKSDIFFTHKETVMIITRAPANLIGEGISLALPA